MTTNNPFDFTKTFAQFDPQKIAQQMQDSMNFDFDAIKDAQNKNIELLLNTNKAIAEGSKALLERQAEMFQQAMAEAAEAAQALANSGSPEEVAKKQAELLQAAYDVAIKNSTEISEMAKQTQDEVAEKVNARIKESLQELKDTIAKAG